MSKKESISNFCAMMANKSEKSIIVESINNKVYSRRKQPLMDVLYRNISQQEDQSVITSRIFRQPGIQSMKTNLRTRWLESSELKSQLLASLPSLTPEQLRRYRIPHHEAVILELEESNLYEAAAYIKLLINMDEEMRKNSDPGSTVWRNPYLKDNHEYVDRLRYSLTILNKSDDPTWRAEILLEIALYFQSRSWEWWWIAECLFRNALRLSKQIKTDDKKIIAMIHFIYGRFLFQQMNDPELALRFLKCAQQFSEGKTWNASEYFGVRQQCLSRESSYILCEVLIKIARKVQETNPDLAVQACLEDIQIAKKCGYEEHIAQALLQLGKSEMNAGQVQEALQHFKKFIAMATKMSDYEGLCRGHKHLAFLYKELDDVDNTAKHLRKFEEIAEKHELPYNFAQANYFIGEHLLGLGDPKSATPHLEKAFFKYECLDAKKEADRARCLGGVSKGQEMMATYQRLLLQCGERNFDAITQVCEWKDTGNLFPISDDDSVYGVPSCDISEDLSNLEESSFILSDDEGAFSEPSATPVTGQ